MQINHKPTKILILGRSGSGKTTYLLRYVDSAPQQYIFIFDHKLEFLERMGIQPYYTVGECAEALKRKETTISYCYAEEFEGEVETAFEFYCEWVYEVSKVIPGTKLIVIDEVNRFTQTWETGYSAFKTLIQDGRLQGLDLISTSHGANEISTKLRNQLTEIVALHSVDRRSVKFLEENNFDPDEVMSLEVGQFVALETDTGTFHRGHLFKPGYKEKRGEEQEREEIQTPENTQEEKVIDNDEQKEQSVDNTQNS